MEMEAVAKFFSGVDLIEYVVAALLVLICAVPFVQVFTELWRSSSGKEE